MGGQCSLVPQPEVLVVRPDGTVMRQPPGGQAPNHYPYSQPYHPGQYYPGGPPPPGYPFGPHHDPYQSGQGYYPPYRPPNAESLYGCRYPVKKYIETQEHNPALLADKKSDKYCRFIEMHHEGDRKLVKFFEGNFAPSAFTGGPRPHVQPQVEPQIEIVKGAAPLPQVVGKPPMPYYATSVDFAKKYKFVKQSDYHSGAVFHTTVSDHTPEEVWDDATPNNVVPSGHPGVSDAKFSVTTNSMQPTSVSQYILNNKPNIRENGPVSDALFHVTMHSAPPETAIKTLRKPPGPESMIVNKQGASDVIFSVTTNSGQNDIKERLYKSYKSKGPKLYLGAPPIVPSCSPPVTCLCVQPGQPTKPISATPKTSERRKPTPSVNSGHPPSEQSKSCKKSNAYSSYNSKKKLSALVKRIRKLLKEQKEGKGTGGKTEQDDTAYSDDTPSDED